jgi:polysaccharide pyruvyl transferase WcaK-like protein
MSVVVTRPTKIGFWGNFGTKNWGNECTLQAIVFNVRGRFPDAELFCFCSEPTDTAERHGLRAYPISRARSLARTRPPGRPVLPVRVARRLSSEVGEWSAAFALAGQMDLLIMSGTGMLTDSSEGAFGLPYDMFRWAVAVRAGGGKVLFTSVGVEPIEHRLTKLFIGTALRLAEYRSYRDVQSREHLTRIGLGDPKDPVYPDLAFSLPEAMISGRTRSPTRKRTVAVGLYDYQGRGKGGPSEDAAYRGYLEKMRQFTRWLLDHDYAVRVVLGDIPYDVPVLEDFRALLQERVDDKPAASVEELLDQLGEVDVVVASRFHSVLLSLLLGKPVVSVSYNEKNDALMEQMGLSGYCQSIDAFEVDRLIDQFRDLERSEARLRPVIAQKVASYRDELREQYDRLFPANVPTGVRRVNGVSSERRPRSVLG